MRRGSERIRNRPPRGWACAMTQAVPLRWISADLHIHSVLSACAEVDMIPPLIVRRALELGLELIAITDHNASDNCGAVMRAASGTDLRVLPGMEVQTVEDIHVVCLFDDLGQVTAWQDLVNRHLPSRENSEDIFGAQYVVDDTGEYISTDRRLRATSTDLTLEDVLAEVANVGGLAIPAHIDRPVYGLIASLGFVPTHLHDVPMELFHMTDVREFRRLHPKLAQTPLLRSSDAHRLSEIRPTLRLKVTEPSIAELIRAFSRIGDRDYALPQL